MIKRLRIQNFKSLADVTIDLEPLTVLIGESGTGKSNLVAALRFLRDYLRRLDNGTFQQLHGTWDQILSATAARPMEVVFAVQFSVPHITGTYEYKLCFAQTKGREFQSPEFAEEKLSLDDQVLFHQAHGAWESCPRVTNSPPPGSLMLGAVMGSPEITTAYLVLSHGIGCYSFQNDVLTRNSARRGAHPGETGLFDDAENLMETMASIVNNLQTWQYPRQITAGLRTLSRTVQSVDLQMPHGNQILVGREAGNRPLLMDARQESEGFRRFLAHLIALYQTPPKQTLVFEDPEKGIHPGALGALAEQFRACSTHGRGQVILTTHSPQLLDFFKPEEIRAVAIKNGETTIGPVSPEQREALQEKLLYPGELLTVDLARVAAEPVAGG